MPLSESARNQCGMLGRCALARSADGAGTSLWLCHLKFWIVILVLVSSAFAVRFADAFAWIFWRISPDVIRPGVSRSLADISGALFFTHADLGSIPSACSLWDGPQPAPPSSDSLMDLSLDKIKGALDEV